MTVEKCGRWQEDMPGRGHHCFNCINRDGYPYRAQPSSACKNFTIGKSDKTFREEREEEMRERQARKE